MYVHIHTQAHADKRNLGEQTPTPAHPARNNWPPPRELHAFQFASPTATCASPSHPRVADLRQRFPEPPVPCELSPSGLAGRSCPRAPRRQTRALPRRISLATTESDWVGIGSFWLFKELQEPVFLSLFRDSTSSPVSPGEMTVPNRGTWAGTTSRPSLPSITHRRSSGRQALRRGTDSPSHPGFHERLRSAPRLAPHPASLNPRHALRPATRATPCVPRLALRRATRTAPHV
jgi:hypothetical protein